MKENYCFPVIRHGTNLFVVHYVKLLYISNPSALDYTLYEVALNLLHLNFWGTALLIYLLT